MREGAAGEQREHADRRDVDGGRRERKPVARPAAGTPRRAPGAPGGEHREHDEEPVFSGFGCARPWPSAISAIAGSRSQATTRSDSAVASRCDAAKAEPRHGLFDQAAPHGARNRGGAIRDSELLVQVLNVRLHGRQPQVQVLRDLREALARGDQVQDLLLARRQRGASCCLRSRISETRPAATSGGTTFSPRAQASTASAICSRRASFEMKPAAPVSSAL